MLHFGTYKNIKIDLMFKKITFAGGANTFNL